MKLCKSIVAAVLASALMMTLSACKQDGPVEEAGEAIDEAIEDAGDAIDDTIEDTGGTTEDATDDN